MTDNREATLNFCQSS